MRNVLATDTAGMSRPHRGRHPLHGRALRPTMPARPGGCPIALAAGALALGGLLHALPAQAIEFGDGDLQGSLDTTLSHGMTFRVENRDAELAGDINGNDGNLNYDRGMVSNASKFTTDLDIGIGGFGAFLRTTGFIDFENRNGRRERTPLSDAARDRVGRDVKVLDAYVAAAFDAGDAAVDVRLGRHVLNWGESTFIPNGINAINPFDVSKLRLPGSELREALLPVGLVSLSVAPTDLLSVEGFYQFDWEETEIDPVGSYFSTTDYAGPGARKAVITSIMEGLLPDEPLKRDLGFGFGPLSEAINGDLAGFTVEHPQFGTVPAAQPLQAAFDPDFASVLRGPDRAPDDSGQWGLALRYLAEDLNETEFGFYFINYHSRLPTVGAQQGSRDGLLGGLAAAGAIGDPSSNTSTAIGSLVTPVVAPMVTQAVTRRITETVTAMAPPGTPQPAIEQLVATRLASPETRRLISEQVRQEVAEQVAGQVEGIAGALAIDRYGKSGHYFLEYPEDIQLFGLSFNTVLGASGWALQGEYSFRRDAPLQRAERTVLEDGLRPIVTGLTLGGIAGGALDAARRAGEAAAEAAAAATTPEERQAAQALAQTAQAAQQAAVTAGQDYQSFRDNYTPVPVKGYVERDVSQVQATATKLFGPAMGADGVVFVGEVALMHVHDMPGRNTTPLESPAGGTHAEGKADADATSWGYRVAARLDYNNAIGAVNLYPYAQFAHDVGGNSPAPSGPFVEGRTALTLGLRADYLSRWEADVGYTRYAGKGTELADRDFISASVKYSF